MASIIEAVKQAVYNSTGLDMLYYTGGDLNVMLDTQPLPCAFAYLIESGTVADVNGNYHERIRLGVFFVDKGDLDMSSYANEQTIQQCKTRAYKFLHSLRLNDVVRVVGEIQSNRVYEQFDAHLTGFAVNVTLEELYGVGACGLDDEESNG